MNRSYLFLLCFSVIFISSIAQPSAELIEPDTTVRIGKLSNGLTYYIRQNSKPEKRLLMRLAVKAGSVQEEDNQVGLAHFAEHMCFNGTKNFKKHDLVNTLEQMGMKFGPELNAFTSFTHTIYILQIPTDKEGLVDKGYQILEDWAHQVSFDDEEIDKERGVIIEEWRLGLGAWERMFRKWFPEAMMGSRFASRLPIGHPDTVKYCTYETLRSFYRDWYRPDLMAVVVVGDLDIDSTEKKIVQHFSRISNPASPKKYIQYDLMNFDTNRAITVTDPEALHHQMDIYFKKYPKTPVTTVNDFRDHVLRRELVNSLIYMRLKERRDRADGPFINTGTYYSDLFETPSEMFSVYTTNKQGQTEKALNEVFYEINRIKKFGFLSSEIEREKNKLLQKYYNEAEEEGKTSSDTYCWKYVYHFISGEPIVSLATRYQYARKFIKEITADEISATARQWLSDDNITMVVTGPVKDSATLASPGKLLSLLSEYRDITVEPYTDRMIDQPLVMETLLPAAVIATKEDPKNGITTVTLVNGVKIMLKPTAFKNNEILFSAVSRGGHSLYPDTRYLQAKYLPRYYSRAGLGEFDFIALERRLAGKKVSLSFNLSDVTESFDGSCAKKDFETLLQMVYLSFTTLRKDDDALKYIIENEKNTYKHAKDNPQTFFYDTLYKIISMNHPRVIVFPSEDQLNSLNLEEMYDIYNDRTANAADFCFFIAGSFSVDSILLPLRTYLGNLATDKTREKFNDVDPAFPKGITDVTVTKGIEPQSRVTIRMNTKQKYSPADRLLISMTTMILNIKLRESLREDMSGTYGVSCFDLQKGFPRPECDIAISWGCSPANADSLTKAVFAEIRKLQTDGPSDTDLEKVKAILCRDIETQIKENSYWIKLMRNHYLYGDDFPDVMLYQQEVKKINVTAIKATAQKHLPAGHYVRLVLMPETKK